MFHRVDAPLSKSSFSLPPSMTIVASTWKCLIVHFDTAHRQVLEVRLANDLRESSEHSRVGLDPCDELVGVLDGNPLHGSAASSSCPPRKAGPVGFEPTTFGSLHFIGAGARCPILVVLAGDLLRSPVI